MPDRFPPPLAGDVQDVLAHTREVWEAVRGRRVFVTGGTGFFGWWLLASFTHACDALELGAEAVVLTRSPEAFRARAPELASHPAVRLVAGDVRTFTAADLREQAGSDARPFEYVMHAATEASAKLLADDPLLMIDTIVQGTRSALELAGAVGARRFLLTSSGAVYGRQPPELAHVPEEYTGGPDCTLPGSAYGEGKRLAETMCAAYGAARGIDTVIARCFAFVGPHLPLDTHFAVGNFIRDALRGWPIRIGGDGTPLRSYLYAADLAAWLWTLLVRGDGGRAYNVGSSRALSIAEVARAVDGALGGGHGVEIATAPVAGAPAQPYVPATARAERELGLREWVPLEEAIRRTAEWARRTGAVLPS
ncbi:MAG: NAD-dependent epimerase/dehydratase family protein [Gemmatimonadetes bacterium]|nr:NAD-dependent epimerase/dehydratase family protein [Gemmatimonadota bacterium]